MQCGSFLFKLFLIRTMTIFTQNVTISLPTHVVSPFTVSEDQILIHEASNHIPITLFQSRTPMMFSSVAVVWICWSIVFYFRYILYDYLLECYKLRELKPIDTLTFLAAFIEQLSTTMLIIYGTIMFITGTSLRYVFGGRWICSIFIYIIKFGRGYSFIGGLMISIYRILLITDCFGFKHVLGTKKLFKIILFIGFSVAISSLFLESYNDYQQLMRDTCQLIYRRPLMILLDEYEQSLGNPSIFAFWTSTVLAMSYSRVFMVELEIIIYAIFFYHMYKHDNSEMLRRLLDPNVTRNRNRTNAVTFFGQFCSFAIELSWTILYIITIPLNNNLSNNPYKKIIVIRFILRLVSFTCIPIIEVLTSKTLRARIYRFSLYDFIFRLN